MNRRDTIIVAVLLNAAVIAVLLMMAITTDDHIPPQPTKYTFENAKNAASNSEAKVVEMEPQRASEGPIVIDLEAIGFDSMLSDDFSANEEDLFLLEDLNGLSIDKPSLQNVAKPSVSEPEDSNVKIVEITVKKGDSLDKIARANNTTIDAIKRLSQLKNEKLSIGQLLKVPVGYKKTIVSSTTNSANPTVQVTHTEAPKAKNETAGEPVYYIVKSGDNPWKIAKQQKVNMDDLLRLNHLNEEKARNLKPGDKIRIQ